MELNFDFLFLPSPPFLSVIPSQAQFKLEAYEKELEGKHADFHKLSFWSYFCKAGDGTTRKLGAKAALVALEEAEAQLDSEKRILDENVQLCSIFELDIIEAESKVGFIFTYAWGHRLFKLESNSEQAHNGDVSESGSF